MSSLLPPVKQLDSSKVGAEARADCLKKKNVEGDERRNAQVGVWLARRAEARADAAVCRGAFVPNWLAFWHLKHG